MNYLGKKENNGLWMRSASGSVPVQFASRSLSVNEEPIQNVY